MIDREARDELIALLRQFRDNKISGNDLLGSFPNSDESAITGIAWNYRSLLADAYHMHWNKVRASKRIEELRDRASVKRNLARTILFLETDLEYRWVEYPFSRNRGLIPFQVAAFLIALPVLSLGEMWLSDWLSIHGLRCGEDVSAILMLTILVIATLCGGPLLRSLLTGIDRRVWPFYRRQDYRDAVREGQR